MLGNNIKMKQNLSIISAIFGQKLPKLGCYTMDNFVIPNTGMLHQWPIYIKWEISLYTQKNYCIYQQL